MPGLGTLINCAGVLTGGILGLLLKKGLAPRFQQILMSACGLSILFLGISGALEEIFVIAEDGLTSQGTMMIIFSLCAGALTGEALNIEAAAERLGAFLRQKTGNAKDARFVDGFVSTSLTICIGAMAVVGSIQDGLQGDPSMLSVKAVLDLIIVFVMTSSLGKGCIFSMIPLGIFQGTMTALAGFLEPVLIPQAVSNMSLVGSMMIFCVGVNLMFQQKIRVANFLPALAFAVLAAFLPVLQ